MRDVPECLSRRYKVLDELIKELTRSVPQQGEQAENAINSDGEAGIKLLCNFWNILKEDPDYDLVHAVQQKLGLTDQPKEEGHAFRSENITCYMAGKCSKKDEGDKRRETLNKIKKICNSSTSENNPRCCASRPTSPIGGSEALPLSKVLCNLKEAASFDKKCNVRINELMETQKVLKDQIQHLEHREKEGVQLLKQADCMWTCMENTYNKKINESTDRQNMLMQQLKELEASTAKWRKNKKDLELQLVSVGKCHEEIKEKINQKNSDLKCMDVEIEDFKKRIENNKKDMDTVKKSFGTKKQASEAKIAKIATEISRLEKIVMEEKKIKNKKEQEGSQYVQEARTELQKISKVLLQKKIENEDLRAEKEALNFELDVLKQSYDQCKDKCKNREQEISNEIAEVEKQIKEFQVKCTRCHECTDTVDIRKCCTDCPRCIQERDCILEKDHCSPDHTMDCVCTSVKQKFLNNVFGNMYTVLEKQVKSGPGKAVADAVLNCLKRSRNGKLDLETRKMLQEFILTTVKKNLDLTIVGGAVKTRCEMDAETYQQLMLCLQQVTVVKPPKEDKATPTKKDSCRRWGGLSECNCPKGPKACICLKKAPPPPQDPHPCPPPTQDKEDEGMVVKCPHKDTTACGIDCAMHDVPSRVGADIAAWRPDPCEEQSCRFSKNMRAAQCVLGPESLLSLPKEYMTTIPQVPDFQDLDNMMTCKCGHALTKPCNCQGLKQVKAGIIKPCDKITCRSLWNEVKEKVNRSYSLIEKEIGKENYSEECSVEPLKIVPNVLTDVVSEAQMHLSTKMSLPEKSYDSKMNSDIKKRKINERFKVTISDDRLSGDQFAELKTTESGNMTLELDEKMIELIDEKCAENPNLYVSLDETDSEKYIINFSRLENITNKRRKISMKKTPSGSRLLEVQKEFVRKLKENEINSTINSDSYPKQRKNLCQAMCDCKDRQGSSENVFKISSISGISNQKSYLLELRRLWDEGTKDICIKVMGQNGLCKEIKGTLIKNSSGDVSVDVSNMSFFGEMIFETGKCPALLTPTTSDSFLLEICRDDNHCNVILRRSTIGGIILVATDSVLKPIRSTECLYKTRPKDEFFRVKIKKSTKLVEEPHAVLKMTPSGNYTFVLDKEYEKTFKKTINEIIGDDSECFVELDKTRSGNFLIIIDDNDLVDNCKLNALLTKSPSGHIKIIADEPIHESVYSNISQKKISTSSSRAFSQLLEKLPPYNRQVTIGNLKETTQNNSKFCSDSPLYDKIKIKLPNNTDLNEPSATLTRTASGQYMVILNRESKRVFANHLRCYLRGNQGLIPIKRTESGEISIVLENESENNNCGYGSLTITPSGNIYIKIDEKLIKRMVNDEKHSQGNDSHLYDKIKMQLPDYTDLPERSATLTRIASRLYAMVLSKKSKRALANHLRCYLRGNQGLIPFKRAVSGEITIDLNNESERNIQDCGFLNITPSGNIYVTIDEKTIEGIQKHEKYSQGIDSRLYNNIKMNLPEYTDIPERSATLTRTASGLYAMILNKQSKRAFANHLRCYLRGNQGLVPFKRAISGEITIDLNNESEKTIKDCGFLNITPSGNIYVTIDEKTIEGIQKDEKYSQGIDSLLYDNIKMKLPEYTDIPERAATLTRTASGLYAMILSKKSKRAFANHLRCYLRGNQGLVPFKKAVSGEITIDLNNESERNIQDCGFLNITPSGNIYVTIDEKTIEGILKDEKYSQGIDSRLYDNIKVKLPECTDLLERSATLTRTASGLYALVLSKKSKRAFANHLRCYLRGNQGLIPIERTKSGDISIALNNECKSDNRGYGSLNITPSGNIYVTIDEKNIAEILKDEKYSQGIDSRLYDNIKVTLPECTDLLERSATLTRTASGLYALVLSKRSKRAFANHLRCYLRGNQGLIPIERTESGGISIDLNNESKSDNRGYGSLKITPSGNIYVTIDEKNIEGILKDEKYSQGIDSRMYDNIKVKLPECTDLLERSATLTRTASGLYALVLSKKSKRAFANHLRCYLRGNKGLIPIERTESGGISIDLNNECISDNRGYGYLKITPSGNIYVTIEERIMEGMVKNVKSSQGSSISDERSKHIIGFIKSPVNKSVTTTCNAKPESYSCDLSKCVCKELQLDPNKWFQSTPLQDSSSYLKSDNICVDVTKVKKIPYDRYEICDPQKCKELCCSGSKSTDSSANKSPHNNIVVKPNDCCPMLSKNPRSEDCCYLVETLYPCHVDRYKTVPNELKKSLSKNVLENRNHAFTHPRIKSNDNAVRDRSWDSLNYLPPQLPRFLRDVNFR